MNNTIQPILFNQHEINALSIEIGRETLMGKSIQRQIDEVEEFMLLGCDVPGHGEAGGYEHNRHKQNCHHMNIAACLYLITKQEKYARFVSDLLELYADKYLNFDFHVQKNTNPTGRLFHQILNEHVWLLHSSLAFSCIASYMNTELREKIITQLFEPMLEMFTTKYANNFDHIHNHGIWAVAAVGICGLAIGQRDYLHKAVYGLRNDETGGFLAQASQLFSPSGYYIEGPYYHRYVIFPICVFSEVLSRHMPELGIFDYKDGVIGNTIQALLATAYPTGEFPALNDASRSMSIRDMGVQAAVSLYAKHYGVDKNILGMAKTQDRVWVNSCGLLLSQTYEKTNNVTQPYWPSVELNEGKNGDKGAQGFLRMKHANDVHQLVMNYGQHGMGHGHFDTLGITYFNRNQEVLREYGYTRWVNVEPKFGGRYLNENKSYARQTIAHNAVTIDQQSQNYFNLERADRVHGTPHFFSTDSETLKGMSAFANQHYDDCGMQRSVFLLQLDDLESPLLVDLYRISAKKEHQYDYSHQFQGQVIYTNFGYKSHVNLEPLGDDSGYQHLWRLADGEIPQERSAQICWLQNNSYYTWTGCSSNAHNQIVFTRIGATDPEFNLRSEPGFMLRTKGKSTLMASVLETHGYYNEEFEQSVRAYGSVKSIRVIGSNDIASVVEIITTASTVTLMLSNQLNKEGETTVTFQGKNYRWQGYFSILQDVG